MAVANFWFCTRIHSSAFVYAYGYRVPMATSARSAICWVVTPPTPCSANKVRAASMIRRRLSSFARSRRPAGSGWDAMSISLDKVTEGTQD